MSWRWRSHRGLCTMARSSDAERDLGSAACGLPVTRGSHTGRRDGPALRGGAMTMRWPPLAPSGDSGGGHADGPLALAPNPPVEVGAIVAGKYRIDGVIGFGGMGIVCAATHLELATPIAIK